MPHNLRKDRYKALMPAWSREAVAHRTSDLAMYR
jgi:hypothetical protein